MSTGVKDCWSAYRGAKDGRKQRNREESQSNFPVRGSKSRTKQSVLARTDLASTVKRMIWTDPSGP